MAATDMRKAGLEVGCKATRIGWSGIVVALDAEEPKVSFKLDAAPGAVWCDSADILRDYEGAQKARQARFEVLYAEYPGEAGVPEETDTLERYVLVQYADMDGSYAFIWGDTFDETVEGAGGEILDGWSPEAVFDLDTGERIEVHVSSPVVTRSEDQGAMINVLEFPMEKR